MTRKVPPTRSNAGKAETPNRAKGSGPVTLERLERAIARVAWAIQHHNLPEALPTLKRLEAERDRLLNDGDPIEYARRVAQSYQHLADKRCPPKNV